MTDVLPSTSSTSSSAPLDVALEAFYARRKAKLAAQEGVAPIVEKAMNQDRPIIKVMVEDVVSGKSKDGGEPYCTLNVVVQPDLLANYEKDVVIKNYYKSVVGTVDLGANTMTLHTNEMKTFKASLDYWASQGVVVKEQSPVVDKIVIHADMSLTLKVDKSIIALAEQLEPFSIIAIGLSCTSYCTTEDQANKKANPEPIKGTSLVIKQIDVLESANAPKVIDYIVSRNKCQVPLPTAKELVASDKYEHRLVDDKKKQKVRSSTKLYLPINFSPTQFFGRGKGLIVSFSTKQEENKSPYSYAEKEKQDALHKKAEFFLTIAEVDPTNEEWNGANHVVTATMFESMLKVFRIASVQRWKEIAPMFFAKMQMIVVGAANLYTTCENPATKRNFRDNIWFDNYLDLIPQQLVVDFPAEVARVGVPVSARWVKTRLAAGLIKQGDHVNQLSGTDKSVINLTEFDSAAALEYLNRPSSSGYQFFVVTDTVPTDGHLEAYADMRAYMKKHPNAPGLEMLLWPKFTTRSAPLWVAEVYGMSPSPPVEIPAYHRCNGQTPLVFKSSVVYAVNVDEVAKRHAEAKAKPIVISGQPLAITAAPHNNGNENNGTNKNTSNVNCADKSPAKLTAAEKRTHEQTQTSDDDGGDGDDSGDGEDGEDGSNSYDEGSGPKRRKLEK